MGSFIKDRAEGVYIAIEHGADALAMKMLSGKFGKPTKLSRPVLTNAMNARFQSTDATWSFSDLLIHYDSMSDGLEGGLITITTPAQQAHDAKLAAKDKDLAKF